MTEAAKIFGEQLRRLREAKGIGLRELAERIPISHTALDRYELGHRLPSDVIMRSIARALDVPYDELREMLFEAQAQSLLRANPNLSSRSREQIMQFIRFAREQDRKAKEAQRREGQGP
ncbi:MAG: helix-turn-helix domain-containing protein [Chloroflexi bacterium]|nr:helix-turn-helix domain-containing protein [Chloroflexota bacterium]MDA8189302.1 helix-turn-helix transcriptional regulator [Dehalococcoidales bacterium]